MAGPLSHCCCGGRDPSSNEEIHKLCWFSSVKSQFLYQLMQLSRTPEFQWKLGMYKKASVKRGETSSSSVWCPVCMHPSLVEKERQQKTEVLAPQQKEGWRSSVLSSKPAHFHYPEKLGPKSKCYPLRWLSPCWLSCQMIRMKIITICILISVLITK